MNSLPLSKQGHRFSQIGIPLFLLILLILSPTLHAANVSLTWDPNNEPDLAGYNIYKRTLPSTDYGPPIFSGPPINPSAPQLTVTNLTEGSSYGFIATAFDSAGNESGPSMEKTTTVAALEDAAPSNIEEPTLLETTGDTNILIPEQVTVDTAKKENTTTTQEELVESNATVGAIPPSEEEYLEDNITEKTQGHLKKKTTKNHRHSGKKIEKKRDQPGKKTTKNLGRSAKKTEKNTHVRKRNN